MSMALGEPIWWFGTTQAQERAAGWDVAGRVDGHWIRFQLKASNEVLRAGVRRFRGHHHQLVELRTRAVRPLSVLYVFPTIGSTAELTAAGFQLLPLLRFLDVHSIPGAIGLPTASTGALRKSELHYFDLAATHDTVTIHSEPVKVPTLGSENLAANAGELRTLALRERDAGSQADRGVQGALEFLLAGRNRVAAFLPAG